MKLIVLSAVTCIAGGSVLLTPAASQMGYPACEDLVGKACTRGDSVICTWEGRYMDGLFCHNGTWE